MSQSLEPEKRRIPLWLIVVLGAAFFVFSLSFGGLVWWLVTHRPAPRTPQITSPVETEPRAPDTMADTPPAPNIPAPALEPGFVALFDGVNLTGWEGDSAVWSVQDGTLRAQTEKRPPRDSSCLFWSGGELGDFEFRFRFRLLSGNAGIYYRALRLNEFNAGGYQFDIFTTITGNLLDTGGDRTRRELFRVDSPAVKLKRKPRPVGTGWHEAVIVASGSRLIHKLDGELLCDISDDAPEATRSGRLALEAASLTIVEFKDLQLKRNPVLDKP